LNTELRDSGRGPGAAKRTTERTLSCLWPRTLGARRTTPECLWCRSVIPMERCAVTDCRLPWCSTFVPSMSEEARRTWTRLRGGVSWTGVHPRALS